MKIKIKLLTIKPLYVSVYNIVANKNLCTSEGYTP